MTLIFLSRRWNRQRNGKKEKEARNRKKIEKNASAIMQYNVSAKKKKMSSQRLNKWTNRCTVSWRKLFISRMLLYWMRYWVFSMFICMHLTPPSCFPRIEKEDIYYRAKSHLICRLRSGNVCCIGWGKKLQLASWNQRKVVEIFISQNEEKKGKEKILIGF